MTKRSNPSTPTSAVACVRQIVRVRRLRDRHFGADLFADPVWDMLLDLLAAHLDRKRVTVTSLCAAACVPSATAQRWLKAMAARGIVVRSRDPDNRSRIYVSLSVEAQQSMHDLLDHIRGGSVIRPVR